MSKGLSWLVSFNLKKLQDRFDVAHDYAANAKTSCELKVAMKRNHHASFIGFSGSQREINYEKQVSNVESPRYQRYARLLITTHLDFPQRQENQEKGSHKN